jgi:preprotein translocase subunit Sec63
MDSFVIPKEDDFYAILGCYENSTNEQISTEYRLKMLKYHPDKASDISLNGMTVDIGVTTHARASIF